MDDFRQSSLEKWLRKNRMTGQSFIKMIGCSRTILWKAKRGLPICTKYANKISEATKGEVKPETQPIGRPWNKKE